MDEGQKPFFDKTNFILMGAGILIMGIGYLLMAGGGTPLGPDGYSHEFDAEGLYSFRRITLAPIVIFIGFIIEVVAILKRPKDA